MLFFSEPIANHGPVITLAAVIIYLLAFDVDGSSGCILVFGYLVNALVNKSLKRSILDPRPHARGQNRMPSGHAQLSFYSIGFLMNFIMNTITKTVNMFPLLLLFFLLALAFNTCYICLLYRYHTMDQLVIGALLGFVTGLSFGALVC